MPLCDNGPNNVAAVQCNNESRSRASLIMSSPTRLLAAAFTCENTLKTCFHHHQGLFRLTSLVSLSPVLLKVEFAHLRLFCTHRGASKLPRASAQANRTNRPSEQMKKASQNMQKHVCCKNKTYSKWAPMGPALKILDPNKLFETFISDSKVLRAAICFYYPPCLPKPLWICTCRFGEFVRLLKTVRTKTHQERTFAIQITIWPILIG